MSTNFLYCIDRVDFDVLCIEKTTDCNIYHCNEVQYIIIILQ